MRDDQESLVGHLLHIASKLAIREGLDSGYRIVINDGKDASTIGFPIENSAICVSFTYPCYWRKKMWLATCISCLQKTLITKNIYITEIPSSSSQRQQQQHGFRACAES